jgi:hypothetical protein
MLMKLEENRFYPEALWQIEEVDVKNEKKILLKHVFSGMYLGYNK